MENTAKTYARIAAGSAIAGSRSMLAPAIAHPDNVLLTAMAAMELCVDKMPGIGNRTATFSLIGRSVSGAVTGAALSRRRHRNVWLGGLLGAAGALAITYLTFYARKQLVKSTGLPDALVGLVEDGLMVVIGRKVMQ
ncbi:MAG TPA: DUF4126 family protein [Chitinophaga sp.]|uniref:DUF4126 family protein n=1 Tax=Chitinophaga sp. TaxID=1869181 RepID=UPI002DBAFB25|nr:DUF4126 family protein [Chitinophaga sp.]HEU4555444.1 DUF4126 family protein [Chitinophaga sp.]